MSDDGWEDAKVSEPFICTECGRRVAPFWDFSKMHICADCIEHPAWWRVRKLAQAIDPQHKRAVD